MLKNEDVISAIPRITPQWVAGFFDGEGSVSATIAYDKYASVDVTITQKDPKILALIMLKYDSGKIMTKTGAGGAVCSQLRIRGRNAETFLKDIAPHVIVKRRQVEKAMEMLDLVNNCGSLVERSKLREEIQKLNREGNISG
jgi:LAGLIDADG-like domain